jgi:hypothetical protein
VNLQPFIWLLLLTLAAMGLSRRRADWTDLALVGVFGYISLLAVRNVALFALIAAPVFSRHAVAALNDLAVLPPLSWLAAFTGNPRPQRMYPLATVVNFLLLFAVIAAAGLKIGLDLNQMNDPDVWGQGLPVNASAWLHGRDLPGKMFNSYNWGGYLIWTQYPDNAVFVDGRTDLYALNSRVLNDYVTIYYGHAGWENGLDRYAIGHVIVERTSPLDNTLRADSDWSEVYEDKVSVVYARSEGVP